MKSWKWWGAATILLLAAGTLGVFIFIAAALATSPVSHMGLPAFILAFLKEVFDFIAALAWPAVVLFLVISFRSQLNFLLGRLGSLDFAGLKLTFDRRLERIERQVAEEATERGQQFVVRPRRDTLSDDRFLRLVDISPSAAVVEKWVEVEFALRNLATQRQVPLRPNEAPMYVIKALRRNEVIGARPEKMLQELRELRNIAAHPNHRAYREISKDEALRFGATADDVLYLLARK